MHPSQASAAPPGGEMPYSPATGRMLGMALLGAVLGIAASLAVRSAVASPAPLGQPLPRLSDPIYVSEGVKVSESSVLQKRIAPELLHVLALQPDGAPPLRYPYPSEHADFMMHFPTGTETVFFDNEAFLKDGIESQANVRYDQALKLVKISMPRRQSDKEKVSTFVSRITTDLRRQGAELYPNTERLDQPAYRFEHFEHKREVNGRMLSNFTYVGPYGVHVIVIQFSTTPELHESCRPYVDKIMQSFEPGWVAKKAMLLEDPTYGEYAGTGLENKDL
ncbi:hypothetical protein IT575_02225 [bacterium]|nr:hypothetical protein [bacterium]